MPPWAPDPKGGPINARVETAAERPSFRDAFRRRRCLIPADGFYEWPVQAGTRLKVPWFIHRAGGTPLAFAGLWERWHDPSRADASPLVSCAIVTAAAKGWLTDLHDRMPAAGRPLGCVARPRTRRRG